MLNSFRSQITYGVDVEQREKIKVIDDMTISRYFGAISKFPSTSKNDWPQGLWEANEAGEAKSERRDEKVKDKILKKLKASTSTQGETHLPTSKPQFAQKLGMDTFNDLVLPFEDVRHLMAACWSKSKNLTIDMCKMKMDANTIGKTVARLAYELYFHDSKSKFKNKVTKIAKGTTGSKTLFAKWKKK